MRSNLVKDEYRSKRLESAVLAVKQVILGCSGRSLYLLVGRNGQADSPPDNQLGPRVHKTLVFNTRAFTPRDKRSAGFLCVRTCRQSSGLVKDRMLETLFATKLFS